MGDSVRVRTAQPEDYEHFVRFFGQLGIDDPVPEATSWREHMAPATLFLEVGSDTVAYGHATALGRTGYVVHVVVDAESRGQGLGRRVMQELGRRLLGQDCTRWELNVMRGNAAAIQLYERMGMRVAWPTTVVRLPWKSVEALGPARASASVRDVHPQDFGNVERAFGLPPGQLAKLRAGPGQHTLLVSDEAAEPVGLARFDPAFPGAFPFRVRDPCWARALLESFRALAPAGSPWVQLVIENDEKLALDLLAAGAESVHEIVHMQGSLGDMH